MTTSNLPILDQEHAVYECICAIAAQCDGAISRDGVGFNGSDTKFGRRIAQIPFAEWTPEIRQEAARILGNTYRVQAQALTGWDACELDVVREAAEVYTNHVARDQARQAEKRITAQSRRTVTLEGGRLVYEFPFDAQIKDDLKEAGQGAFRFDGSTKTWQISPAALNRDVVNVTLTYGFRLDDAAEAALEVAADVEADTSVGTVIFKNGALLVTLKGKLGRDDFSAYRSLADYSWVRGSNESWVAATPENIAWLDAHGFTGALEAKVEVLAADAVRKDLAQASRSAQSTLDLSAHVPTGLEPYPFQVAGVEYALNARRTFIADEMGLGKTVQAILTIEASESVPAIIVCPATLKGNWAREIARWAPQRTVHVGYGRNADIDTTADYNIVNYDLVGDWIDALIAFGPHALVLDESHYAKNPAAKRTKALIKLAEAVPSTGLVLALTGTPVLNRPIELITQLKILGRLADIAPRPQRGTSDKDYEFSFKFRYCDPQNPSGYGWTFQGTTNGKELNNKLRASCFIRREREDVLNLKATTHIQIPLALNGALADYRRAEKDVIAFIKAEKGDGAANRARQAEVLVGLNLLRRLAEEAKVAATIEWVEDWLESYPTKSLVIFAGHVSVQKALVAHFNCPSILGGQKNVEAQKELFQSGAARVIVCSLQAAREGHTLTAASDVVFTSLGWTPGGLQQAEDRCNRIGQEADQVVAWQLHAEGTIDEQIGELIANKRRIFKAVVNGDAEAATEIDEEVLEGVINWLESKGE